MNEKLDDGLLDAAAEFRVGEENVGNAVDRVEEGDEQHVPSLAEERLTSEAGQAVVPDFREQLLHVRMSDELRATKVRVTLLHRVSKGRLPTYQPNTRLSGLAVD